MWRILRRSRTILTDRAEIKELYRKHYPQRCPCFRRGVWRLDLRPGDPAAFLAAVREIEAECKRAPPLGVGTCGGGG